MSVNDYRQATVRWRRAACARSCSPEFMQYNTVGLPLSSIEIKLNNPQDEVCICGPSVTEGYFKHDDLNNDESIFTKA